MVVPKFDSCILTPCEPEKLVKPQVTLHPCQIQWSTHNANLMTASPSVGSRDTAHRYYCDRLKTYESRSGWPSFCVQAGFTRGSVHARLQMSVYSGNDLCHSVCLKIWFVHFDRWPPKVGQTPGICCTHGRYTRSKFGDRTHRRAASCRDIGDISRCTHDANLVTVGRLLAEIMQI